MKKKWKVSLVLGLVLLLLLCAGFAIFLYEYLRIDPNNLHFTDVTSNSVTVSWNTKAPIPSAVIIRNGDSVIPISLFSDREKYFDTRDVKQAELSATQETSNNIFEDDNLTVSVNDFQTDLNITDGGKYYTHHVTVTGLNPETEYSFMVGDKYLFRNASDIEGNMIVKTLGIPDEIRGPLPAYGSVKNAENKENISIDGLLPVTDGIIYFNYFDEFTGERSAVYSSSFNEEGNWYMDISNAIGDDGEHFISRFDKEVTNILVELMINAGPLGEWKKIVNFESISPTELIVINDPLSLNNSENGLLKLSSQLTDYVIKDVSADSCQFTAFCGPCGKFDNGVFVQCACPTATLEYRNCNGESNTSLEDALNENATQGADSSEGFSCSKGSPGDYTTVPGEGCKQCNGDTGKWERISDQSACEGLGAFEVRTTSGDGAEGDGAEGDGAEGDGAEGDGAEGEIVATTGPCANKIEGTLCNRVEGGLGSCTSDGVCGPVTITVTDPYEQACLSKGEEEECDLPGDTLKGICLSGRCVAACPISAELLHFVSPGSLCEIDRSPCSCSTWQEDLNFGQICPDTDKCTLNNTGDICNPDGTTCIAGECSGIKKDPSRSSLFNNYWFEKFFLGVNAENDTEEYIMEQNLEILEELIPGKYIFEYEGETYFFKIDDQRGTFIYIDKNDNDEYDKEIDVLVSDLVSIINIKTIVKEFNYNLLTGLNFVNLPYLVDDENSRTAAGLLQFLNEEYDDSFYSISRFNAGKWDIVGQNVKVYDNNDFQLIPGEGYIIKSKQDINIKILGRPIQFETESDEAPISFNEGWNLIGLYGTNVKSYTAKTLIQDINIKNFISDNVTKWSVDKQMYEGLQIQEEKEYGFDFPLNILESYFVRIIDGNGNWKPSLAE